MLQASVVKLNTAVVKKPSEMHYNATNNTLQRGQIISKTVR